MSFSKEDPSVFVVGTESGLVLKCSTQSTELPLDKGTNFRVKLFELNKILNKIYFNIQINLYFCIIYTVFSVQRHVLKLFNENDMKVKQ